MDNRRMCPHCRAFIKASDRVCPYCENEVGPRAVERRSSGDLVAGFIPPTHLTSAIILLANILLFVATALYSMRSGGGGITGLDGRTLVLFGAKYPPAHQWWRLITAGFLHGGLMHILFNSWALFDLGAWAEQGFGRSRMWAIYLVSSVCGFYLSGLWSPSISVGASAGIFGLIGAMIALSLRHPLGPQFRGMFVRWAVYGLVIGLLPGLAVDNAAHIGGLASGFVVAYFAGTPHERPEADAVWRIVAYACLAITAVGFAQWYMWFSRI